MRQSSVSYNKGQEKSFLSNQSKAQNHEKFSVTNANAINEKVEEENQIDQSQTITIPKLEFTDSKHTHNNNFNQISSSSPPTLQQQQSSRGVLQSAFPVLQTKVSDIPQADVSQFNRPRSLSTDNQKNEVLEQQFLDLLNDVRKIKDEDASKGYYESQDQNENENNSKKIKKRKSSDDSDFGVEAADEEQQDIILDNKKIIHTVKGKADCQMVRSSSLWSCGVKETECSIHIAYIQLIGQAQHFIYIENQFFISGTAGDPVKNNIAQALVSRIKQAHQSNEQFRVIVVVPLLPGFEGEIDGNSGVLKVQLHWEYQTICRGGSSIYEMLQKEKIPNPEKYISFYGLRTHAQKPGQDPVTEIVYVHSKLMIVDDRIVIMGSANINDRSMKGSRDSEIAMVVEDKEQVKTIMRGQPYLSNKFAYTLRQSLFQEHFGLQEKEMIDPLDNDFFEKIQTNSKKNTWIYREVFRCYPDDNIKVSSDYEEFKKKKNLSLYENLKDQITGYAVEFPKNFLEEEDLRLKRSQKEFYCPDINFT